MVSRVSCLLLLFLASSRLSQASPVLVETSSGTVIQSSTTSETSTTAKAVELLELEVEDKAPTEEKKKEPYTELQFAYTGGTMGLGTSNYNFVLPAYVSHLIKQAGDQILSVQAYHGAVARDQLNILAEDGRVETLLEFFETPLKFCQRTRKAVAFKTSEESLFMETEDSAAEWVDQLSSRVGAEPVLLSRCESAHGHRALIFHRRGEFSPDDEPKITEFSFRLALRITLKDGQRLDVIGSPSSDAARRVALIRRVRKKNPITYFDVGSFIDGPSTVADLKPSLFRRTAYDTLSSLSPSVLVPGESELAFGARVFFFENGAYRLPYIGANWKAETESLSLPAFQLREYETDHGPIRIAFIGVVDPEIQAHSPYLSDEGITLEDPVTAVRRTVKAINQAPERPHAILVLTSAGNKTLNGLLDEVRGVDLIVGDTNRPANSVTNQNYFLRAAGGPTRSPIDVIPVSEVASLKIKFVRRNERWLVERAKFEPLGGEDVRLDRRIVRQMTETRAREYRRYDQPLLKPPGEDAVATLSKKQWANIACEAVREKTGADVVLLPSAPRTPSIPGTLTELLILDRLPLLDRLEVHSVPGASMAKLLRLAAKHVPTGCGAHLGVDSPLVLGRAPDPLRTYRVVTTDRARIRGLGALFSAAYTTSLLDKNGPTYLDTEEDTALSLRGAVFSQLKAQRGTSQKPVLADALLTNSANIKSPLWLFRLDRASLSLQRFQGADNPDFSNIPETLATSPSSLNLDTDLDTSLVYDSSDLVFDVRFRSQYGRTRVTNQEPTEATDDWRLSASGAFPKYSVDVVGLSLRPFLEALLDSEFTAVTTPSATLPTQADLSLTLGAEATPTKLLKRARVGALIQRDLSRPEREFEFGGRTELETLTILASGLRLTSLLRAVVFGNTPQDDDSDLRFSARAELRLGLPLWRFLGLSLFTRAFVFQGRVPPSNTVGASYSFGVAFDASGALPL